MRFLVCALSQFCSEREEHPLTAKSYMVKVFHSLTHKACLLNILQVEMSDHLCQTSKLAKHKPRAGSTVTVVINPVKKCCYKMRALYSVVITPQSEQANSTKTRAERACLLIKTKQKSSVTSRYFTISVLHLRTLDTKWQYWSEQGSITQCPASDHWQ